MHKARVCSTSHWNHSVSLAEATRPCSTLLFPNPQRVLRPHRRARTPCAPARAMTHHAPAQHARHDPQPYAPSKRRCGSISNAMPPSRTRAARSWNWSTRSAMPQCGTGTGSPSTAAASRRPHMAATQLVAAAHSRAFLAACEHVPADTARPATAWSMRAPGSTAGLGQSRCHGRAGRSPWGKSLPGQSKPTVRLAATPRRRRGRGQLHKFLETLQTWVKQLYREAWAQAAW